MSKLIKFILIVTLPSLVHAEQCVLQDKTVTRTKIEILERDQIQRDVVPEFGGKKRCLVSYRARIGNEWHTAFGEYTWDGVRPNAEACAVALRQADESVKERVGKSAVLSDRVLICKDQDRLNTIQTTNPGTVGDLSQFRPHPKYPNRFMHNGTQCKWFVDTEFTGKDVQTFQGIICQVQNSKWTVVDKF
jgi:hypothetical protein